MNYTLSSSVNCIFFTSKEKQILLLGIHFFRTPNIIFYDINEQSSVYLSQGLRGPLQGKPLLQYHCTF